MISENELNSMTDEEIYCYIKENKHVKLPDEIILFILCSSSTFYSKIVYELAKTHHLPLSIENPLYLFENYNNFEEEDFFYLCRGFKIQIERGFEDFYMIIHRVFQSLFTSDSLKNLLLFLIDIGDYKIREYLIAYSIFESVMNISLDNLENRIFFIKFWIKIIDLKSPIVFDEIFGLKIKKKVPIFKDCCFFFKNWVVSNNCKINELFELE